MLPVVVSIALTVWSSTICEHNFQIRNPSHQHMFKGAHLNCQLHFPGHLDEILVACDIILPD